jgi:hypothetical protein
MLYKSFMKKLTTSLILIGLFSFFTACGKEKLTPAYKATTVNQLKNNKPIYFSYKIDDTQIDEYAKNAGKFPIFGKLFKAIAVVLANSTITSQGGHELELGSIDVDLSGLQSIDLNYVDWIKLNSLLVEIRDSKSKDSLRFIDKIEIYAKLKNIPVGIPVNENGMARLLFFDSKEQALGCSDRCLSLEQAQIDWKQLLKENQIITIHPKIEINSVPLSSMKLAGSIDFSVKFNLGF